MKIVVLADELDVGHEAKRGLKDFSKVSVLGRWDTNHCWGRTRGTVCGGEVYLRALLNGIKMCIRPPSQHVKCKWLDLRVISGGMLFRIMGLNEINSGESPYG